MEKTASNRLVRVRQEETSLLSESKKESIISVEDAVRYNRE